MFGSFLWLAYMRIVIEVQELSERALFLAVRLQELVANRMDLGVAETLATLKFSNCSTMFPVFAGWLKNTLC